MANEKNKTDSGLSEKEKSLLELIRGQREPVTEKEKRIMKEVKEKEAEGGIVELPYDLDIDLED